MAADDVVKIMVVVFALGLAFLATHFMINESVDRMLNVSAFNESAGSKAALEDTQGLMERLDWVVFAIFMGLVLGLMITSWLVAGNPIFMFFYFLVLVIVVVVSAPVSNVWETVSSTGVLAASASSFPVTNHLLGNLPWYVAVVGFVGVVVMFAKPRGE